MIWCEVALLLIGLGTIILVSHLSAQLGAMMLGAGIAMIAAPLGWRFLRIFWRLGADISSELRVASTPIPTPAQIAFQLQAEWGRPATLRASTLSLIRSPSRSVGQLNDGTAGERPKRPVTSAGRVVGGLCD
jgi:hypothetical protein